MKFYFVGSNKGFMLDIWGQIKSLSLQILRVDSKQQKKPKKNRNDIFFIFKHDNSILHDRENTIYLYS